MKKNPLSNTSNKLQWFADARFGLFIHWGPYSVAGRGEWVMNRERMSLTSYQQECVEPWRAENYDPERWVALAKKTGMKYLVLTTRHHDGFCLWDTQTTTWNAKNMGPKKDLVRPFVDAVRNAGLGVGLYYSGADWSHLDYPGPFERDWPADWPDAKARDRFMTFCMIQMEELLTHYGKIDLIWFDGCIPKPFAGELLNRRIYELQPDILINNRNGEPCDFQVCEKRIQPCKGPWEACFQTSESWSWMRGQIRGKHPGDLLRSLLTCAKDGGNFLLNVGPQADGAITEQEEVVLAKIGEWMRHHGESVYGSERSPFSWNTQYLLTIRQPYIYLHLLRPIGPDLRVTDIANRVVEATWLHDGSPVDYLQQDGAITFRNLPEEFPITLGLVIALRIEGVPRPVVEYTRPEGAFWL